MTDYIPKIEMNVQDGYADIDFVNPKKGACETTIRLNPRELIMLRDLLLKHFPTDMRCAPTTATRRQQPEHRTYESCHKHFSCPDGEECWYASEDYYWDCGKGASKLAEEWKRGYDAAINTQPQPQPDALAERLEELVKHPDGFIGMTDTPAVFTQRIEKIITTIKQEREQQ